NFLITGFTVFSFSVLPLGKSVEWRESDPGHSRGEGQKPEARSRQRAQCPGFRLRASSSDFQLGCALATQAQTSDQGAVTSSVLTLQVVQQLAALVHHADQTTTGVVVLAVGLEVVLQLVDVGGQQGYLHFRGTSVAFVLLVLVNDLGFFCNAQCHGMGSWSEQAGNRFPCGYKRHDRAC